MTIQKRGPDSWRIRIEGDRVGGKRKRLSVMVKGSYKYAQRERTKLQAAADAGMLPAYPAQMTVGEYLTTQLDSAHDVSPKTARTLPRAGDEIRRAACWPNQAAETSARTS